MVTSSSPETSQSIFASVKFKALPFNVYSLFGPPTLIGGDGRGHILQNGESVNL